jgi:arylsulfatase A-like enzyme
MLNLGAIVTSFRPPRSSSSSRLLLAALLLQDAPAPPATKAAPGIQGASAPRAERPNLLLVTLDTTRADHLGCYGDAQARTPVLDQLARDGVLFERALACAPITLPSHASILTGLYPVVHGVRDNGTFVAPAELDTLAELLKREGYATAAFVSSHVLAAAYGLAQGFDVYDDRLDKIVVRGIGKVERRAAPTANAALAWLDAAPREPWFLWVHFYDPHAPYAPPDGAADLPADPYDAEIAYVDKQLGRLLQKVDAGGRRERTLVAVTADHGEGLGDHRELTHGLFVYDATMAVPLLLRGPGLAAGRRVGGQVSHVDLFPTLIELLGVAPRRAEGAAPLSGASLAAELRAGAKEIWRDAHLESMLPRDAYGIAPLEGACRRGVKLIRAPRPELYHVDTDRGELDDRHAREPELAAELAGLLEELRGGRPFLPSAPPLPLDDDERKRLAQLGYGGDPSLGAASADMDPKDAVELIEAEARAKSLMAARKTEESERFLRQILARVPGYASAWALLGQVLLQQGKSDEARAALEQALVLRPDTIGAAEDLARLHRAAGRHALALRALEQSLAHCPSNGDAWMLASDIALETGDRAKAIGYLEKGRATLRPDSPALRALDERLAKLKEKSP